MILDNSVAGANAAIAPKLGAATALTLAVQDARASDVTSFRLIETLCKGPGTS